MSLKKTFTVTQIPIHENNNTTYVLSLFLADKKRLRTIESERTEVIDLTK